MMASRIRPIVIPILFGCSLKLENSDIGIDLKDGKAFLTLATELCAKCLELILERNQIT